MGSINNPRFNLKAITESFWAYQAAYERWTNSLNKIHLVGDESSKLRSDLWAQYVEARDKYHRNASQFLDILHSTYKDGDPDPELTLTTLINQGRHG